MQVHAEVQVFTQQSLIQALQCGWPGPRPGCPVVNTVNPLSLLGKQCSEKRALSAPILLTMNNHTEMRLQPWVPVEGEGRKETQSGH